MEHGVVVRADVARLDEREVEDELVLRVIEQHEVRVHPLRDVLIDLHLELGCAGLVRHGSHRIASCDSVSVTPGADFLTDVLCSAPLPRRSSTSADALHGMCDACVIACG